MILIADSGSTKTDWRLIDQSDKIQQFSTSGINPYYQTDEKIKSIINKQLKINEEIKELHFYGAGCSSQENKNRIIAQFKSKFNKAEIFVEEDMLAAARSLSGKSEGIICILGTGSNACHYNGEIITQKAPSLGYALGDEGSGSWLGRQLLNDYFGKKLSKENKRLVEIFGNPTVPETLDNVYRGGQPSAYLAHYSRLIHENISNPYFYELVYNSFQSFIETMVKFLKPSRETPIQFTGSISFMYANILRKVVVENGLYIDKIIQSPIAGLTLFHQNS